MYKYLDAWSASRNDQSFPKNRPRNFIWINMVLSIQFQAQRSHYNPFWSQGTQPMYMYVQFRVLPPSCLQSKRDASNFKLFHGNSRCWLFFGSESLYVLGLLSLISSSVLTTTTFLLERHNIPQLCRSCSRTAKLLIGISSVAFLPAMQ